MDKENNRSAAGLRRSAIAERLRLREEWLALKGITNEDPKQRQRNTLTKKPQNILLTFPKKKRNIDKSMRTRSELHVGDVADVLRGMVVLVDVGSEIRALALRAALTALGATVMPAWSTLVTHVVWSEGGCRATRAKARALACELVSPLWVEACAAAGRKLPERVFPAPARPSDLPSPTTLKILLTKAEHENVQLQNLLSDSNESDKERPARLRISSVTDNDTTHDTTHDTTRDTTSDKSHDRSRKHNVTESPDPETRVNTVPRRALPVSISPQRPVKSKRKLFTQKEAEVNTTDESDKEQSPPPRKANPKLTHQAKRELAQAERIARRLMGTVKNTQTDKITTRRHGNDVPRIVLTGMSRRERNEIWEAIKKLNGKVQKHVSKRTTHIIMGPCNGTQTPVTKRHTNEENDDIRKICQKCYTPEEILTQMFINNVQVCDNIDENDENILCNCNISGIGILQSQDGQIIDNEQYGYLEDIFLDPEIITPVITKDLSKNVGSDVNDKPRTVNALLGAVRGCRVLYAQWVRDSVRSNRWLHHFGYEVPHFLKISQRASVERSALEKTRSEYAYNIFNGIRVNVSQDAEQKDAVEQLLELCGAFLQNGGLIKSSKQNGAKKQNGGLKSQNGGLKSQNGGLKSQNGGLKSQNGGNQDGGTTTADFDITIGREDGEVSSKWVFDSIVAARMRTTRRYVNKNAPVVLS